MAKFRDSIQDISVLDPESAPGAASPRGDELPGHDRSIGDIIAELRNLTAEQVERILVRQRETGVRFGEAAVGLGLASKEDVLFALAQQFDYPYAPGEGHKLGSELVVLHEPFSLRAESFRALRSQLMMRLYAEGGTRQAVAVVSPNTGDGKTYCAANVAAALAQLGGGRTLFVDANMRAPRAHEIFNVNAQVGLSGILSGRADKQAIQQVPGIASLFVLPVGATPPNPVELVERPAFALLVRELAAKFDHVIVDTPASSVGSEAGVIAARCGAAIVVARKDQSRLAPLRELIDGIQGTTAKLAGVVVNEF